VKKNGFLILTHLQLKKAQNPGRSSFPDAIKKVLVAFRVLMDPSSKRD
jgi:hypothetical protein